MKATKEEIISKLRQDMWPGMQDTGLIVYGRKTYE
jgi:hypothetical protein